MSDFPIPSHDTWGVTDSTKLQTYMSCPRKYFYEYVLGWRIDYPTRNHLDFGSAFHVGMEVLRLRMKDGLKVVDAVREAGEAFLAKYRETWPASTDAEQEPKTPSNALLAYVEYVKTYGRDDCELLATELAGSVPIHETLPRIMHFKMDYIGRTSRGIIFEDYKTASRMDTSWQKQWSLSQQMTLYFHVLHCMYPPEEIAQGRVVGFFFYKSKPVSVARVPVTKPLEMMEDWLLTTNDYVARLEQDFAKLAEEKPSAIRMGCFNKNVTACSMYGGCPFMDFCSAWANPLQRADMPPPGFKREFWDPRSVEERATSVVHIPHLIREEPTSDGPANA